MTKALAIIEPAKADTKVETVSVTLSPFAETPLFYRTTVQIEGAKRWFDKSRVTVAKQSGDTIVLTMPKSYADTRKGIATLIK